jgi:hypothetical protein
MTGYPANLIILLGHEAVEPDMEASGSFRVALWRQTILVDVFKAARIHAHLTVFAGGEESDADPSLIDGSAVDGNAAINVEAGVRLRGGVGGVKVPPWGVNFDSRVRCARGGSARSNSPPSVAKLRALRSPLDSLRLAIDNDGRSWATGFENQGGDQ